jgi:uncharacterized membrane protein
MNIDYKKPIISSIFSMGITFIITFIILLITQPSYIMEVSKKGTKKKNLYLLLSYSLLFSVLIGIIVLLFKTDYISLSTPKMGFNSNPKSFKPITYTMS